MNTPPPDLNIIAGAPAALRMIALTDIAPSPTNPRTTIDPATIAELAASIKVQGVLQPILVRLARTGHTACEIVAGHRRFAACKLAGLTEIPAIVRDLTDVEVLRVQLIENLQREGLHEMEEGEGYQRLIRDHGYTARQIAGEVGKSIEYIYARVKLCALSPECRQAFRDGKLSASTAVLVARIPSDKLQLQAMKEITEGIHHGYTTEPMTHRRALNHIHDRYMLTLDKAPFDTKASRYFLTKKDKEPLPRCFECPKRTGACPELFTDVKSPDTCTDPTCFAAKRDGETAHLVAEAERKGKTVITGKAAKEIFPNHWSDVPLNGYLKENSLIGNTGKTLLELVTREHLPAAVLVQNPHDKTKLIKVYDPTALAAAFEKAGVKASLPKSGSAGSGGDAYKKKQEAAMAAAALQKAVRYEIFKALRAHMKVEIADRKGLPFEADVRRIAEIMADSYEIEQDSEIAERVRELPPDSSNWSTLLKQATTLPDLFLLMWEMSIAGSVDQNHLDAKNDCLLRCAADLQVDAKAIETRVKMERKAEQQAAGAAKVKKEKPVKAAPAKSLKDASTEELEEAIGMAGESVAETMA